MERYSVLMIEGFNIDKMSLLHKAIYRSSQLIPIKILNAFFIALEQGILRCGFPKDTE